MSKSIKKSLLTFVGIMLIACVAIVFSACGDDENKNQNPSSFNVTCQDGEWYDISTTSVIVPAGDTVTVTVETEPFVQVDKVYANSTECTVGETAGQYTFVMPAEDVTITATVVDAPEILIANYGMGWTYAPDQIAVAQDGDSAFLANQEFRMTFGGPQGFITNNTNEDGLLNVEVYSTNQDVIPNDAISGANADSTSGGSLVTTASFEIDLTQVNVGTTTIIFEDTQKSRIISKTVEVKPYGEAHNGELWTVSITLDMSDLEGTDYQDKNFRVFFTDSIADNEYVYGSDYAQTQFFDFTWADLVNGEITFEFKYNPEHNFDVSVAYQYWVDRFDDYRYNNFTVVSGAEDDGTISFDNDEDSATVRFDDSNLAAEIE